MNITKAIGAGLLVFAVQFASVNVIGNTVGPFLGQSAWVSYVWQAAMVLLLVAIVYCAARWYFTGNAVNAVKGVYLGAIIMVTGFAINLLQTIPAIVSGQSLGQMLLQDVKSAPFWVTVAITIGAAALAGYVGTRRHVGACNIKEAVKACIPGEDTKEK